MTDTTRDLARALRQSLERFAVKRAELRKKVADIGDPGLAESEQDRIEDVPRTAGREG